MKTLIAYATRQGSTERSARALAEALAKADGREVAVKDARAVGQRDIEAFDSFVVGSSIMAGQWKGSAKRLCRKLAMTDKPVAVFVSAGGVINGPRPGDGQPTEPKPLAEREAEAIKLFVEPVVGQIGVAPCAVAAFGGRMTMFGRQMFDSWDGARVAAWAAELVEALK